MHDAELGARLGEAVVADAATRESAERVLTEGPVGFLGLHDADGPFVLPVSFAYAGDAVHLHGGPGKKSLALADDARVCLTVCSPPELITADDPCSDNFRYRSVLVYGVVTLVQDDAGREAGLRAIVTKYHPERADAPLRPATLAKTLVYRMDVRALTYRQYPED